MICPAKINLGLQVHHRRPEDGYHYITSIFLPISFADELRIEPSSADSLESVIELPPDSARDYRSVSESGDLSRNILWKLLEKTRELRDGEGLRLLLTKRIPTGGGLGGGSSNAGALLRYIQERYDIPSARIEELAIEAGADVPFFLRQRPCLVSGIGDRLEEVEVGSGLGVLAVSGIRVNTAEAYSLLKRALQGAPPPKSMQGLDQDAVLALRSSDWRALRHLRNDFASPVFSLYPALEGIQRSFYECGAELSLMSGSGSVIYALVSDEGAQDKLCGAMQDRYPSYRFVPFSFGENKAV